MDVNAEHSELKQIPVDRIKRNKENPRILIRQGELDELLESIRLYGVQVPISVYRHKGEYVLIDGERRWMCCIKLNKKTVPGLVQQKPSPLTNLLLMFNIHALREEWDLLTIALKLPRVMELIEKEKRKPANEVELAEKTGLSRAVIRRSKILMDLPNEFKELILRELGKPKAQQKFTEDFFIEMERALKTVERAMPDVIVNKNKARHVLISKYDKGIIDNIVHLRNIAKIARAEYVEADKDKAATVLKRLFEPNDYSIQQAFEESVSLAYSERDLITKITSLIERLEQFDLKALDEQMLESLKQLQERIRRFISSR